MTEQIVTALIDLVPTVIWATVVVIVLLLFRDAIRKNLLPRVTHVKAFGLEIEASVKENLDRVAAATPKAVGGNEQRTQVARRANRLSDLLPGTRMLLVNDNPSEMSHVIALVRGMEIDVHVATSTEEALAALRQGTFDVVNSDMRRGTEASAGLDLIKRMRAAGYRQPVILTVGNYEPQKGVPPFAFGITNRVDELCNLLFDALERIRL